MLNELYTFAEPVQVVPFSSLKWGKFTLLHTSGQDAARLRLVVPGSGGRHEEADERAFFYRPSQPLCRHAYRFTQFPFLCPSRIFPQDPMQPYRRRPSERKAACQRDGFHPPDGKGHITRQCSKILQLLKQSAGLSIETGASVIIPP